jgi:hypothetical protein
MNMVDGFPSFKFVPTVHVETEDFSGEVIGMYEMPHKQVISALTAPHGPVQLVAMLEIFKLALVDQAKREEIESLSFNSVAELLGQWTFKSTALSAESEMESNELDKRLNPEKIVAMLANPDNSLDDVLAELNRQLEDFEPLIRGEVNPQKKRRSFFGFTRKKRKH